MEQPLILERLNMLCSGCYRLDVRIVRHVFIISHFPALGMLCIT
jgi:hypothetical protein